MAGVTDYAFRKMARRYGADFCISEMVSAKAMSFNDKKNRNACKNRAGRQAYWNTDFWSRARGDGKECIRAITWHI